MIREPMQTIAMLWRKGGCCNIQLRLLLWNKTICSNTIFQLCLNCPQIWHFQDFVIVVLAAQKANGPPRKANWPPRKANCPPSSEKQIVCWEKSTEHSGSRRTHKTKGLKLHQHMHSISSIMNFQLIFIIWSASLEFWSCFIPTSSLHQPYLIPTSSLYLNPTSSLPDGNSGGSLRNSEGSY